MFSGRKLHRARALPAMLSLALSILKLHAPPILIGWELNTETNIVGYRLFLGHQPGVYVTNLWAGNTNRLWMNITNRPTFVAVKAVNADNIASDFSNEIQTPATNRPARPVLHFPPVPNPPWTNGNAFWERACDPAGPWERLGTFSQTNEPILFYRLGFEGQ